MHIEHKAPTKSEQCRGPGFGGGGRPGQILSWDLTRAPVFSLAIALLCSVAACTGPGLEPPEGPLNSSGTGGMASGGMGGVGGASGASGNPMGGMDASGGTGGTAAGGVGGNIGGAGGGAGVGGSGGAGGAGGAGGMGGTAGGLTGDDAGSPDSGAPIEECEIERDVGMLQAGTCQIVVPADVAYGPDQITLAITNADTTLLPPRLDTVIACSGEGFAYSASLIAATMLELCPATCELANADGAVVELIYGCEPPIADL
jgi:hypothetical protein